MQHNILLGFAAAVLVGTVASTGATAAPVRQSTRSASDREIRAAVQRALSGFEGRVTIEVQDGVVTLSGAVPTLWAKQEAIKRVLKAANIQSLASELTIPTAEDDAALAKRVAERIHQYERYTLYDNIDGRVGRGIVRLSGAVTAPEKLSDILERVAKVKGVQDIDNKIEVLPASDSDNRLRVAIANAIYQDPVFENYSRVDPPIRVIVNNGHVALIGYVRGQEELIRAESSARMVFGVLALENKVQLIGKASKGGR